MYLVFCYIPGLPRWRFLDRASLIAQLIKNPPAVQETEVQSLVLEDTLEEEMTTHSIILAWKIP